MDAKETALLFFAGALLLLSLCAMSINVGSRESKRVRATRWALAVFGIVPGFAMVMSGAVVQFTSPGDRTGLGMLSAGLLLEMGALQLWDVVKRVTGRSRASCSGDMGATNPTEAKR